LRAEAGGRIARATATVQAAAAMKV